MSPDQILIASIRIANALLWLNLGHDIIRNGSIFLSPLARKLVALVIMGGMTILAIGAFAPTYIDPWTTRMLYTVYTGFSALVALAIRRTWKG